MSLCSFQPLPFIHSVQSGEAMASRNTSRQQLFKHSSQIGARKCLCRSASVLRSKLPSGGMWNGHVSTWIYSGTPSLLVLIQLQQLYQDAQE